MNKTRLILIGIFFTLYFSILSILLESQPIIIESPNPTHISGVIETEIEPSKPQKSTEFSPISYKIAYNYTNELKKNTICTIPDHSFSENEVKLYWDYKPYGKCKTSTNDQISIKDNILYAKCQSGKIPSIQLDDRKPQTFGGKAPRQRWEETSKKDLEDAEYVNVLCEKESTYSYVFSRFKGSVSEKAKNTANLISKTWKPLSVVFIVFDSVSRENSFRFLKKSTNFITKVISTGNYSNFVSYDFKYSNVADLSTRDNLVRMLYGDTQANHEKILKGARINSFNPSSIYIDLQEKALWSYFSKLGYVTYFSFDTNFDYFGLSTGRYIQTDHQFLNFWKAAKRVYGYTEFKEGQRCLGDQNAHWFSFNHSLQFYNNYRLHNRFGYIHVSAAHENSGNIQTVDEDFEEYLKNILFLFNNTDENLAFVILSDHGRGNTNLNFDKRGFYDHRLPMFFLIMDKDLENKLASKETLKHNTNHLIGRFDINLSLKTIAKVPYQNFDLQEYQNLKSSYSCDDVLSLFHEKISINRTCDNIGVKKELCLCNDYEIVNLDLDHEQIIINEIIEISLEYIKNTLLNNS